MQIISHNLTMVTIGGGHNRGCEVKSYKMVRKGNGPAASTLENMLEDGWVPSSGGESMCNIYCERVRIDVDTFPKENIHRKYRF